MKTHEAIAALEALNKITASVPLKFAYAAARSKSNLGEFAQFYETKRQALLKQYGAKKEDGELDIDANGNVKLIDIPAFSKGLAELNEKDVTDLKLLHQVALADFPANIDLGVMEALLPMVLEPKPPAENK